MLPPPSFTRTQRQIRIVVIKIIAIYLPSQRFLGCQLGFHIFFAMVFWGLHHYFYSLAVLISLLSALVYSKADHMPALGLLFTCFFFLYYRKEKKEQFWINYKQLITDFLLQFWTDYKLLSILHITSKS